MYKLLAKFIKATNLDPIEQLVVLQVSIHGHPRGPTENMARDFMIWQNPGIPHLPVAMDDAIYYIHGILARKLYAHARCLCNRLAAALKLP